MRSRDSPGGKFPNDKSSTSSSKESSSPPLHPKQKKYPNLKLSEILLCVIVIAQFIHISSPEMLSMKLRNAKSLKLNQPSYMLPELEPKEGAGLVIRKWHSNGSPSINSGLKEGSCWCSADDYCMCTPSLAIDTILTSGPEHFWLVKRKDAGKYATMGGFVEVGETSAEAVRRELMEEMNIDMDSFASSAGSGKSKRAKKKAAHHEGDVAVLEGVYSDPMRDHRRHTVSIVYSVDIPMGIEPKAGDDAAEVVRVHHDEIADLEFFADHKTILMDYIARHKDEPKERDDDVSSVKRDLCTKVD